MKIMNDLISSYPQNEPLNVVMGNVEKVWKKWGKVRG